jgi:hypothetical protein
MDVNKPISQQIPDVNLDNISKSAKDSMNSVSDSFDNMRDSINDTVSDFSTKDSAAIGSDFITSNTLVAKFVFLLLVLIIFFMLFNLGVYLIGYFLSPNKTPYIVRGLINGNTSKVISQDPKKSNSVTIYRSNNRSDGIEFTWCVWLKRDLIQNKSKQHIFNKGDNAGTSTKFGNSPGVYFTTDDQLNNNIIEIIMDTASTTDSTSYEDISENVEITNLPLHRWFHIAIRVENKVMDIYVNGAIAKRVTFTNIPKQNYGDIHVCRRNGFAGNLSDLRYFDKSLNVFQILNIVNDGPNLRSNSSDSNSKFDYLSSEWYMGN